MLDVGCGTGLAFPLIEQCIGTRGQLIGIELSSEMLARARRRVGEHGWANVTLIESAAEEAAIPAEPGAVLFCLVPSILRSPQALTNVFGHLRRGARVAAAGPEEPSRWTGPVWLGSQWGARHFGGTSEQYRQAWLGLAPFVPDLHVRKSWLGVFFAWGHIRS